MKISLKITLACTLLGAGLLIGTPRAHAALLAYEGFDYEAGSVSGENGGEGWDGAWSAAASTATVVTGTTLSYSNGSISLSGSGTALSITGGGEGSLYRGFEGADTGSELYFSFLFQVVAGNEFSYFYLSDTPNSSNSGGIGDLATSTDVFGTRIVNTGITGNTAHSAISYTLGTTYLLVGRLSTDGGTGAAGDVDRVQLWVNPSSLTPGSASVTVDGTTGLTIDDFVLFGTRTTNFDGSDQILIDELRIGTDFASVVTVPEPSVGGLAILGGASLLALCRKASRRAP